MTMPEADVALTAEFEPATREAWLTLVAKVLKGADFEKRLVSRTSDGLAVKPLYTRADAVAGAAPADHGGWYPGGWDVRQRHGEPSPEATNRAILEDLEGGVTSVLLQVAAPGQAGLPYGPEGLGTALRGLPLKGTAVALDALESALDAAGSLLETWRAAGINENERRGAFNYDPLGVLAKTGTLTYPAQRASEIAAKFASDARSMSHVTALLADGRPYHEAGGSEAQELAAVLATLVAYLRACEAAGLRPRMALGKIALALAADADLFLTIAKLRAARRLVPGLQSWRRRQRGGGRPPLSLHLRAHDGATRPVGEPAAHHRRLRRRSLRRCRGHHRAPLHMGAGQARRLRAPPRPQHPSGAAGGERGGPRHRSRARLLVRRDAHRRPRQRRLGAVPGDRGQGRHGGGAGERLHPGRDRARGRGARRRHRARPH
jgi:hypothetical protein